MPKHECSLCHRISPVIAIVFSFYLTFIRINLKLSAWFPFWLQALASHQPKWTGRILKRVTTHLGAREIEAIVTTIIPHRQFSLPVQVKYKFCETVFTSRIICHFCIALRRRVESSWAPFNRFSLSFTLLTHTRRCRFPSLFLLLLMLGWLMLALALLFHFATA